MSEFHKRRNALYAEFPAEADAYEAEYVEAVERLMQYERALIRIEDLTTDEDQTGVVEKIGRIARNTLGREE